LRSGYFPFFFGAAFFFAAFLVAFFIDGFSLDIKFYDLERSQRDSYIKSFASKVKKKVKIECESESLRRQKRRG
jgi:hypothetical protein